MLTNVLVQYKPAYFAWVYSTSDYKLLLCNKLNMNACRHINCYVRSHTVFVEIKMTCAILKHTVRHTDSLSAQWVSVWRVGAHVSPNTYYLLGQYNDTHH